MTLPDRRRRTAWAAVLMAALLLATPAAAAEPRDQLFQTGMLSTLPAEAVLTYSRHRTVPDWAEIEVIEDGALTIRIEAGEGATRAAVRIDEPEREVVLPPAPTTAGHPALLIFLESTVNSLAAISGGSPFYIKNRFIESFAEPVSVEPVALHFAGTQVDGERMLFRPFEGDPNGDKLGALSGLELAFVLSEAVPGRLASASASATGGAFSHVIEIETAEGVE